MTTKKYLEFMQVQNKGKKTRRFHIFNKISNEFLDDLMNERRQK